MSPKLLRSALFWQLNMAIIFGLGLLMANGLYAALSCLLGSFLVGANFLVLIWGWQRIFLKKTIALAVGVIVFKYAILGLIIYLVISLKKVDELGFLLGLGTSFPTVIIFALSNRYSGNIKRK